MSRKFLVLTAALLASAGAVTALAHGGGERGWRGHHGYYGHHGRHHGGDDWGRGGRRHGETLMRLLRLDADNDGAVTMEEFLKRKTERFAELDTGKDGSLDANELTARMQQRAEHRARMIMARIDTDGDGKVAKEDFGGRKRWGRVDRDDGDWRRGDWRRGDWRDRHGMDRDDDRGPDRADAEDEDDRDETAGSAEADQGGPAATGQSAAGNAAGEQPAAPAVDTDRTDKAEAERGWRGKREGRRGGRSDRMFARMDANGDGVIDMNDLMTRVAERIDYAKRKRMHVLDKDRDGKVSADEFMARRKQRFVDLDLDGDGRITAKDLPPMMAERWEKGRDRR